MLVVKSDGVERRGAKRRLRAVVDGEDIIDGGDILCWFCFRC
jgi:hypothetical protein